MMCAVVCYIGIRSLHSSGAYDDDKTSGGVNGRSTYEWSWFCSFFVGEQRPLHVAFLLGSRLLLTSRTWKMNLLLQTTSRFSYWKATPFCFTVYNGLTMLKLRESYESWLFLSLLLHLQLSLSLSLIYSVYSLFWAYDITETISVIVRQAFEPFPKKQIISSNADVGGWSFL